MAHFDSFVADMLVRRLLVPGAVTSVPMDYREEQLLNVL
jgi:hypothetical protein